MWAGIYRKPPQFTGLSRYDFQYELMIDLIDAPSTQKEVGYTKIFEANRDSKASVIVNVGGAGSSKSYSVAQLLISKLITEDNKVFGILRKTFPALRMTSLDLILGLLKEYGIYKVEHHNKTANTYSFKNSTMHFFGLDDPEKVKSTSFNYIWIEEANEITWEDFIILKTRLRAPKKDNELNQMFLTLNPSDSFGWIPTRLCGVTNAQI